MAAAGSRYFTWWRFAKTVLAQFAILGVWESFWYWKEGALTAGYLAVVPAMVWINLLFGLRWRDLAKQERSGELSMREYHADSLTYLKGSKRHWMLTVGGATVVAVLWVIVAVIIRVARGV